jgi:hypothetical protein
VRWALALLLLPICARADGTDEALKLLELGMVQFQAGKIDAARENFLKARDLVPDKPNPHRWLGLVYARTGKCSLAVTELDAFIRRVPPTDPRTVEAVTLRERCQAELKPRFGALLVESIPSQASVRLDDAAAPIMGVTPYRNEAVPLGSHLIVVEKNGFQTAQKGVMVGEKGITRVSLELVAEGAAPVAERKKPRYWIYGVAGGAVVVVAVALGVGLGVGLNSNSGIPTLPPIR